MTEKFSEPHDLPLYELADIEQRTEEYIANVLLRGGQLAHQVFSREADAYDASDAYTKACAKNVKSISDIENVNMTAKGEGVLVTNVKTSMDNNTGTISFETNPTECLVPLTMFDARQFHYRGVIAGVVQTDKDAWKVKPCIIGTESVKGQWDVNSAKFGFPLTKIVIESQVIIPCYDEDVQIEIDQLVRQRQCAQALKDLARQDVEKVGLADDVNRIYEVFAEERDTTSLFVEVSLLRAIGKKGIEFGAEDDKKADTLNTALAKTIGVDRPLILDGRVYKTEDDNQITRVYTTGFHGKVLEVISQLPVSEKNIGPTLVMTSDDEDGMRYVPLAEITSLKY